MNACFSTSNFMFELAFIGWFSSCLKVLRLDDMIELRYEWRQTDKKNSNREKKIEIRSWIVTHRIIKMLQTNMIHLKWNMKTNAEHEEIFFFLTRSKQNTQKTNNNNKSKLDFRSVYNRSRTHKESGTHFVGSANIFIFRLFVELARQCVCVCAFLHLSLHRHSGYAFAVFAHFVCKLVEHCFYFSFIFAIYITMLNSRQNLLNILCYVFSFYICALSHVRVSWNVLADQFIQFH